MVNKHDQFESFILERLARGVTKTQISRELAEHGVSTTHDQILRWLKRRADRIVRNAGLVNPLQTVHVVVPSPAPTKPTTPAAPAPEVAPRDAAPVTSPPFNPKAFMRRRTLNVQIPTEEELIKEQLLESVDSLKKQTPDNS